MNESDRDPKSKPRIADLKRRYWCHFSGEDENGGTYAGSGFDTLALLSSTIEEIELDAATVQRLKAKGMFLLGHVLPQTVEALEEIIGTKATQEFVEQWDEMGFSQGMVFHEQEALITELEQRHEERKSRHEEESAGDLADQFQAKLQALGE